MNITVYSFSPKNETSLTYHSMLYLQQVFKDDKFNIRLVGGHLEPKPEDVDAMKDADLVIMCGSLFHLSIHQQQMVYLDKLMADYPELMRSKTFTYYSTSGKIFDVGAHGYMERFFKNNGLKAVRFCSQYDASLIQEKGRVEIVTWFKYLKDVITLGDDVKFNDSEAIVKVVDTSDGNNPEVEATVTAAIKEYETRGAKVTRINIRDYKILNCNACFRCYTERVCCLNKGDDWVKCFEDVYKECDVELIVGAIHNGTLGPIHKVFLERQVQLGRFDYDQEHISAILVDCPETREGDADLHELRIHSEAMAGFGGNTLAEITRLKDVKRIVNDTVLFYNNDVYPAENFYGLGIRMKFAKLSVEIKNMTPTDYEHFKQTGDNQPWQSDIHVMPVHSAEGAMMAKKGRLFPYKAVIADAEKGKLPDITPRKKLPKEMPKYEYVPEKPKKKGLFGRK